MHFDKTMVIALLVLVTYEIVSIGFDIAGGGIELSLANWIISTAFALLWPVITIYLLRQVAQKPETPEESNRSELGVIGYIWRTILVQYGSFFFVALIEIFFLPDIDSSSISHTFYVFLTSYLFTFVLIWMLFSTDRKG